MPIISRFFQVVIRHLCETAIYAICLLAIAYGLTVFRDFAESHNRPAWFILAVDTISIAAIIADAVAWILLILLGLKYIWKALQK